MTEIRCLRDTDKQFWYRLDQHLPETEFENKVRTKRGYVLLVSDQPIGLLRYQLFWDQIPFCTMLIIEEGYRGKRYGKQLLQYWEKEMKKQGHGMLLTSTQVDETAQHFYRKMGYKDCGGILMDVPPYAQPMELFLMKAIA